MSKAQLAKLHTVIAKLERLENTVREPRLRERLSAGKSELIRALNMTTNFDTA